MQLIAEHGKCFICGSANPCSMQVRWWERDDGTIVTDVTLTENHQGPPGFVHGGASAALLDEAMGVVVWRAGNPVATVNLQVEYHKPLPIETPLHIEAKITDKTEKTVWARGEIRLPDGELGVVGRGIFVAAPHLFQHVTMFEDEPQSFNDLTPGSFPQLW